MKYTTENLEFKNYMHTENQMTYTEMKKEGTLIQFYYSPQFLNLANSLD